MNTLKMFISRTRTSTFNASGNNQDKTVNINNSSNVKMQNDEKNNNNTTTSEDIISIKIAKSKIFNEQRTKLENWLLQLKLYFVFNSVKNDKKTFFAISRMKEKIFNWIKLNMKRYLHNDEDIGEIFFVFDKFKIFIRRVFSVINEIITFIKVIQYLSQKTSAADYVQRFKKHANNMFWNSETLIIMFYKSLKSNVKNEIMRKDVQYSSLDAFIIAAINIDDNWYKQILKKRFEKKFREKTDIHHEELIRRRSKNFKKKSHDDGITLIKINVIEHRKKKKNNRKNEKKCYSCEKIKHFARNCWLKNVTNRRQINVLLKISNVIDQNKEFEDDSLKIITNEKYYRIENIDELQKVLNDEIKDKILASNKEVNTTIRRIFNKSKSSYSYQNRFKSNDEHEWSEKFQSQLREFEKNFVK